VTIQYCQSFLLEQLTGVHDFSSDTFKLALFDANAHFDQDTTAYSTSNEIANGTGYTTGGATLALASGYPKIEGNYAAVRFGTPAASWTFTSIKNPTWALLYNTTASNKAILSIYFGNRSAFGDFSITFPLSLDPIITARAPMV